MTRFVILTISRTGSTHLNRALNKHPEICCDDEIFGFTRNHLTKHKFRYLKIPLLNRTIGYLLNYPLVKLRLHKFLDKFYSNKKETEYKAKGFKLRYNQLFYTPGILEYIKINKVKVIFLQRENIFQNALSLMRANSTGIVYKSESKGFVDDVPKFKINIAALKKTMDRINDQYKKLNNIVEYTEHITIDHEDFKDWDKTMNRLENFLGVSEINLIASLKKGSDDSLNEMIINLNEVSFWLNQNGYGRFINQSA